LILWAFVEISAWLISAMHIANYMILIWTHEHIKFFIQGARWVWSHLIFWMPFHVIATIIFFEVFLFCLLCLFLV